MPTASLVLPFTPLLDVDTIETLRRRAMRAGQGLAYAASSVAMAAFLWLLLAGPGFITDGASTTAHSGARHGRVVAQR